MFISAFFANLMPSCLLLDIFAIMLQYIADKYLFLRKKNHNRYLKNHESIKKYRKESLVLMESYEKYFIEKYGNNLYNKRSYYEFLITKSNMMSNYIKSQQKIIEYQWSMALKNPFTKIKLY